MSDKITIPQQHIDFCKAVAKQAAEAGYRTVEMTIWTGHNDAWDAALQMKWMDGRFGDDATRVIVTSTVTVRASTVCEKGGAA